MNPYFIITGLVFAYFIKDSFYNNGNIDKTIKNYFSNSIFIDVRTKEEYDQGHFNNAINVSFDSINNKVADRIFEIQKNKNIVVYCRSGRRAKIAYNKLKNFGIKNIYYTTFDYVNLKNLFKKKNN